MTAYYNEIDPFKAEVIREAMQSVSRRRKRSSKRGSKLRTENWR